MGNFDHKNICVQIKVRENLTDSRFVEFMKDWNFTEEEGDFLYKSIWDSINNEHSRRIVQFFIDYKEGVLLPDRCGAYEPLKHNFDKTDITAPVKWLSQPAGALYLKKRHKFQVEIKNEYYGITWIEGDLLIPKRALPEYMGKITFWFSKHRKIEMEFLKELVRDMRAYLNTDYGVIYDQETGEVLFDSSNE